MMLFAKGIIEDIGGNESRRLAPGLSVPFGWRRDDDDPGLLVPELTLEVWRAAAEGSPPSATALLSARTPGDHHRYCYSIERCLPIMKRTEGSTHMPEYLSARTISIDCDVTERTVRNWIADGELRVVRFGTKCVRVPWPEYEAFKLRHFAA